MFEICAPTDQSRSLPASTGPQVLTPVIETLVVQGARFGCLIGTVDHNGQAPHVRMTSHTVITGGRACDYICYSRSTSSLSTAEPTAAESTLDRFRSMLDARRLAIGDRHYHALGRQLSALLGDEAELSQHGVRVSMVSFEGLLQFLRWNQGLRHPSLSIDRHGQFVASWSPQARSTLAITFEGVASARWTGIQRIDGKSVRASGGVDLLKIDTVSEAFRGWAVA